MKYLLVFLLTVLVGGGIALSLVGVPSPKSDMRVPIQVNVQHPAP